MIGILVDLFIIVATVCNAILAVFAIVFVVSTVLPNPRLFNILIGWLTALGPESNQDADV
ncbi:hypothetical protein [Rhodococcus sp. (in: high G+C Gram-positive bacteria)]|uniref:hypothetical protein n=1 Tax=Rhodococcus sp. TaxID=1831 RepID=UPI00257A724A|nr:hypothetical protein [Rhodococcus sp. (in: high G+C Gram-positive bacteria)]MBQ7806355.1 hypothetical protein [Rhodococcus sp. (in: high G+C Gram-positive bacteria)]